MKQSEPAAVRPQADLGKVSQNAKGRGSFKHLPRPPAPWRGLALASHGRVRCGRDLKGSFATTLTPALQPVTALRPWWPPCSLTSRAPLLAPLAPAEAAA